MGTLSRFHAGDVIMDAMHKKFLVVSTGTELTLQTIDGDPDKYTLMHSAYPETKEVEEKQEPVDDYLYDITENENDVLGISLFRFIPPKWI